MLKSDIAEIKRRYKKDSVNFDRICGCYVNGEKNIVLSFNKTFLALEDAVMFKYLEIAKKSLSGKIGNNLLELEFLNNETQKQLQQFNATGLKEDEALLAFYQFIIDSYDHVGNYLIVLFHETYDIPVKTKDNLKVDESEEVFDYFITAICPVELSKASLGYLDDDITNMPQNWIVSPVETAFMYPCFSERTADFGSLCVYTKDTKEPHTEIWEALGVKTKTTATQKQMQFEKIIEKTGSKDDSVALANLAVKEYVTSQEEKDALVTINSTTIADVLCDNGFSKEEVESIKKDFEKALGADDVIAEDILDNATLKNSELLIENKNLKEKVSELSKSTGGKLATTFSDNELIEVLVSRGYSVTKV